MKGELDSGFLRALTQTKRKSARVPLSAEINMRRTGRFTHKVTVHDFSREGCRVLFLECPELDERVWIKFDGLEGLEAVVCWVTDKSVGVEFVHPIHPAVFEFLVQKVSGARQV